MSDAELQEELSKWEEAWSGNPEGPPPVLRALRELRVSREKATQLREHTASWVTKNYGSCTPGMVELVRTVVKYLSDGPVQSLPRTVTFDVHD